MTGQRGSHQQGWLLPVLALAVVAAGIAAGFGIRHLAPQESSGGAVGGLVPSTTTSTGPPPGPTEVQLSPDAASHPQAEVVKTLLQRHFDAINNHNYGSWASTVIDRRSRETPEDRWLAEYATTRDGNILVHRIEPSTEGLVVLLSFTSTQDAANAPRNLPGSTCTRWWVSFRILTVRGQPRIGDGIPNTTLNKDCRGA